MDETAYAAAIKIVEAEAQRLGHSRINPESLLAIQVDGEINGWGSNVRAAFNVTMHGFQQLLAPKGKT